MTNAFIAGLGPLELGHRPAHRPGDRRAASACPQLGRQLGGGMREFKDSVTTKADEHFDDDDDR